MATITKREGGQLVQTDANTQELAQLQGVPVTPTTPAGVAAMGANPDQAKMAGTPAQKNAVLQPPAAAPQQAQSLRTSERQATARQQASTAEEQAANKATQLASLGSLNTRVEALIANDLKLQSQANLQSDQTVMNSMLAGKAPDVQAKAQELVDKMLAAPGDQAVLAEAAQFWQSNGLGNLDSFSPAAFQQTVDKSLGAQAAGQIRDNVTLENLPLEEAESSLLQEVFGDGWQQYSMPELAQKIEEMRQAEYAKVENLRAEMGAATGTQREMIRRELADLGQVGVGGQEQGVKDLQKQVATADEVTIGEQSYKVEDLLKDEQISDLVSRMVRDDAILQQVAKTNPEFAAWVTGNKQTLANLSQELSGTKAAVVKTQAEKKALANLPNGMVLSDKIMRAIMPDWDTITAGSSSINSGLYTALTDPKLGKGAREGMVSALEMASADPDMLAQLATLSPEKFKKAYDLATAIDDDETGGLLAKLAGVDKNSGFILDEAAQLKIAKAKTFTDALSAARDTAKPGFEAVIQDQALLAKYISEGRLLPSHIAALAQNPQRWTDYKDYNSKYEALTTAQAKGDIDSMLDTMFGRDVDVKTLNEQYALAKKIARVDPDSDAAKQLKIYEQWDTNKDGVFDKKDAAGLGAKALSALNPEGTDKQASLDSFLKAGKVNTGFSDLANSTADKVSINEKTQGSFYEQMSKILSDGKISKDEMMSIGKTPGALDKLYGNDYYKQYFDKGTPATLEKYNVLADQAASWEREKKTSSNVDNVFSSIWGSPLGFLNTAVEYNSALQKEGQLLSSGDLQKWNDAASALDAMYRSALSTGADKQTLATLKDRADWATRIVDKHNTNLGYLQRQDALRAESAKLEELYNGTLPMFRKN